MPLPRRAGEQHDRRTVGRPTASAPGARWPAPAASRRSMSLTKCSWATESVPASQRSPTCSQERQHHARTTAPDSEQVRRGARRGRPRRPRRRTASMAAHRSSAVIVVSPRTNASRSPLGTRGRSDRVRSSSAGRRASTGTTVAPGAGVTQTVRPSAQPSDRCSVRDITTLTLLAVDGEHGEAHLEADPDHARDVALDGAGELGRGRHLDVVGAERRRRRAGSPRRGTT